MSLIDRIARGVIETIGKDDFRRIMNETLDHMLRTMTRRERMQFCVEIVDQSVRRLLEGLSSEEKAQLTATLVPRLLAQFPSAQTDTQSDPPDGAAPVTDTPPEEK
ncbi:MAG: hypothetical protein M1118_03480 [Chloroflexi bacterium]|nr:hypothetical protein [Chloroflexota bacterium]